MSDTQVIKNVLSGDTHQFEGLVERYLPLVRGVCASRVYNRDTVDDLVQESFLISFTKLNRLKNPTKFGPWIASIARNTSNSYIRSSKRSEYRIERIKNEPQSTTEESDPSIVTAREELYTWVRNQIAALPPKTREAMMLSYVEGYSIGDIAVLVGTREGAIKKRLQYGRKLIGENIWREDGIEHIREQNTRTIRKRVMTAIPLASAPWLTQSTVGASTLVAGTGLWLKGGAVALVLTAVAGMALVMTSTEDEQTNTLDQIITQPMAVAEYTTSDSAISSSAEPINSSSSSIETETKPNGESSETNTNEPIIEDENSETTLLTLASGKILNAAGLPIAGVTVTPMYLRIPADIERLENSSVRIIFKPENSKFRNYFYGTVISDSNENPIGPIITNDDGAYIFKQVFPNDMAELFNFDISFQLTAPGYNDYITRFIPTGSEIADIKFIPGGSIRGKVRDIETNQSIPNAKIILTSIHQSSDVLSYYKSNGRLKPYSSLTFDTLYFNGKNQGFIPPSIKLPELTVTTGPTGEWQLDNVPFGLYGVKLRETDYVTVEQNESFELTTELITKNVTINAEVGAILEGTLLIGGQPAPNQKAYAYVWGKRNFITDDTGRYRLSGIPEFSGSISARRELPNGGSQSSLLEVVEITPGFTTEVNFDFAGGTAAVEGYVLMGADRKPVPSRISLTYQIASDSEGLPNRESISAQTDEMGYFIFENLLAGEVFIACSPIERIEGGSQRRDVTLIEGETSYREILIFDSKISLSVKNIPETTVDLYGTLYKGWLPPWEELSDGEKLARMGKAEQMLQQIAYISNQGNGQGYGVFSGGIAPGKYTVVAASWPCTSSLNCIREMGLKAFFKDFKIAWEHITITENGNTIGVNLDFNK